MLVFYSVFIGLFSISGANIRAFFLSAIDFAKNYGYEKMYLDSLSTSTRAVALYRKNGFVDTEKYNNSERSDVFMVLNLKGE